MTTLYHKVTGPRVVMLGVEQPLTIDVYDEDDNQQTATAGTVKILIGGRELVATTAATSLGPPASYTLPAATTEDESPTEHWLEVWSLTIDGTVEVFQVAGHLARRTFRPTVTDAELVNRHRALSRIRASGDADFSVHRELARQQMERDLIKRGRRPWLIFDNWALHDAHTYLSLALVLRDAGHSVAGSAYTEEAREYMDMYRAEMDAVKFRWDHDETGKIDNTIAESAMGPLAITAGPMRRQRVRW